MSEAVTKIDTAIERGIAAQTLAGRMERMLALAGAVAEIRERMTPEVMAGVMVMQNNSLGFRVDKPYPVDVVRDCFIEAVLHGLHPVGNEFNIIGGRMYITKEGMGHKLAMIPGLWYSITPGIPRSGDGGAVVPMTIEWKHAGTADKRTLEICTKLNAGMGADAIIGKATRKARAWLYQHVSGQELPEGDAGEKDVTPPAERRELLRMKAAKTTATEPAEASDVATDCRDWRGATAEQVIEWTNELIASTGNGADVERWALAEHGKSWADLPVAMKRNIGANWKSFSAGVNRG